MSPPRPSWNVPRVVALLVLVVLLVPYSHGSVPSSDAATSWRRRYHNTRSVHVHSSQLLVHQQDDSPYSISWCPAVQLLTQRKSPSHGTLGIRRWIPFLIHIHGGGNGHCSTPTSAADANTAAFQCVDKTHAHMQNPRAQARRHTRVPYAGQSARFLLRF